MKNVKMADGHFLSLLCDLLFLIGDYNITSFMIIYLPMR